MPLENNFMNEVACINGGYYSLKQQIWKFTQWEWGNKRIYMNQNDMKHVYFVKTQIKQNRICFISLFGNQPKTCLYVNFSLIDACKNHKAIRIDNLFIILVPIKKNKLDGILQRRWSKKTQEKLKNLSSRLGLNSNTHHFMNLDFGIYIFCYHLWVCVSNEHTYMNVILQLSQILQNSLQIKICQNNKAWWIPTVTL